MAALVKIENDEFAAPLLTGADVIEMMQIGVLPGGQLIRYGGPSGERYLHEATHALGDTVALPFVDQAVSVPAPGPQPLTCSDSSAPRRHSGWSRRCSASDP